MEDIFKILAKTENLSRVTEDLLGKVYGLTLAVVADVQDPLELNRIRVFLPSKGTKTTSDWLSRLTPSSAISVPLVQPGDTVVVGFLDGSPNTGVYLGVLNNIISPPAIIKDSLVIQIGNALTVVSPDSTTLKVGDSSVVLKDGSLAITGVNSVTINGKEVTTVGAKDSDRDTLITRGW